MRTLFYLRGEHALLCNVIYFPACLIPPVTISDHRANHVQNTGGVCAVLPMSHVLSAKLYL